MASWVELFNKIEKELEEDRKRRKKALLLEVVICLVVIAILSIACYRYYDVTEFLFQKFYLTK